MWHAFWQVCAFLAHDLFFSSAPTMSLKCTVYKQVFQLSAEKAQLKTIRTAFFFFYHASIKK